MGQPITVVERDSRAHPGVVRFEINRPLSGMGHERYLEADDIDDVRPVDEIARRLFATGKAAELLKELASRGGEPGITAAAADARSAA